MGQNYIVINKHTSTMKNSIHMHYHQHGNWGSNTVQTVIGDGTTTLFWKDQWLEGKSLAALAPNLVAAVPKHVTKSRTVQQVKLQTIWDLLQEVQLVLWTPDQHRWSPSPSVLYSFKSAYDRFLIEAVGFEPAGRIWKNWAPPRCNFFIWLATHNRCWTTDQPA
jgi:hypothetical protein